MAHARFLLRPRWLLSHLFVVALVVAMVGLGFWQLRRLDEKRDRNELIESRMEQPVVPVDDLLAPGDDGAGSVADARFRRVTATGTYDDGATVEVRNRSQDGSAGAWLVTPLALEGGGRVGVLRGFVSFTPAGDVVEAPVPDGEVTVEGLVVDPGSFDGTAPATSRRCWRATTCWPAWCWPNAPRRPSRRRPTRRRPGRPRCWLCRRPSCPRGPTSATPSSGSSSRPSRWWAIPWCCAGW